MAKGISVPVVQSGLESSIQQGVKNVGQINIPVNIDPGAFKNLAQPLGRVSGLATEFEKSIAASNARVLAFGASVGIINGVQNAFASLVKTGIEVQKTLGDIAAISGKGGQELSKFGDALFEVGKTTGQSFKTAAQAALEFSRQGLSVEETLKRTTDALTLTRFTSLNAAEAVDVLTAAANSFGETGITTAQIINKLVAVDTKFAVSAEDLANGLARAGSIAQEVGVSFDELNAAITVAQERTARGGAVIGNALKTIFTRLRSDETVQALRNIGVESLNAQGQLKGAIPLLQELSQKLQGLSGGERVQILEAVASKYNINILSALINDLNDANSKFGQAVGVSAGANNQAYERQIELNKLLSSEINKATVSTTQLLNKLAEIGVTESLGNLLKFVNNLVEGFNKILDSESVGGNIAKGLIKGISDVFFTVGLPIIGAIFIKLTTDIAKFGVESLKTILGINQKVRERQALEQAVVNTLIKDKEVMSSILALSGNRAKQEEYLLGVYNRQLTALQQVQSIASSVTPALMAGGLSATTGQIKKRSAGGYLPAQEAADVRRGVGGASPSSRVVSIPNFAFGGGKRGTMIANTSEYIVPNFANGGSAIFNRDMARAYGLPAGAKKISAAGGYVPNFASQNAIDAMRRIISDPAAPQGEKNAAASKLSQLTKASSLTSPRAAMRDIVKRKLPISQEDKNYLNQNKEKIIAGMGRSFGMLFNLDALEMGDINYVKRLDPVIAKKLSEIAQKQGGRDSIRSLIDFGSAARGYIPNFARYVYDADRIQPDKNALLKAILASGAKKNLLVGPAGSGKSTYGASLGAFITNVGQLADATEIDILSGAARTKDGGISKNFQQIADAVNASGGKISYLYAGNMDILSRRMGRVGAGPSEGDLRSQKQIAGSMYAPLNQFDFISKVKGAAQNFEMIRGAKGYIPNFANTINADGKYLALVGQKLEAGKSLVSQNETRYVVGSGKDYSIAKTGDDKTQDKILFNVHGVPEQSATGSTLEETKAALEDVGKNLAIKTATAVTGGVMPKPEQLAKAKARFNPGSLRSFAGSIFEASVGALLGDKSFEDISDQTVTSRFDFDLSKDSPIKTAFGIKNPNSRFLEVKGSYSPPLMDSVARKIYDVAVRGEAATSKRKIGDTEGKQQGIGRPYSDLQKLQVTETIGGKQITKSFASQKELEIYIANRYSKSFGSSLTSGKWSDAFLKRGREEFRGASGYIPNFAQDPLKDAIGREMAAGVNPSAIRVTQDGRLRNAGNPNGLAVINTKDEPNGKIPNFVKIGPSKIGYESSDPSVIASGGSPVISKEIQRAMIAQINKNLKALEEGKITQDQLNQSIKDLAGQNQLTGKAGQKLQKQVDSAVSKIDQGKITPKGNDKFELSTNKLMASFIGLQMATSTLQSTFKDTDSVVGKALSAFGQIATSAAGYGSLGSLAGETLKDKKGMLGKMAGYLGPAGMIAGAGIGIFQAINEIIKAPQIKRESEAMTRAQNVRSTGLNLQDALEALQEDAAKIQDRKNLLEPAALDRQKRQVEVAKQGGPFVRMHMNDQEKKDEEELLKLKADLTKNEEERKKIQVEIAVQQQRQIREEKRASEELAKRIALASVLNEINEKFSSAQNNKDLQRAKNYAVFIKNSGNLSENQKTELELQQKLLEIDYKKADSMESSRNKVFQQIASASKLATVDKGALESLMKRVESGEKLEGIYQELEKLETQGAINAKEKIQAIISEEKQQQKNLSVEREKLELISRATIQLNNQLKTRELLNKATDIGAERNKKISRIADDMQKQFDMFEIQQPVSALERSAAAKGFSTREKTFRLTQAKRNLEIGKEEIEIEYEKKMALKEAQDAAKSQMQSSLEQIQGLAPEEKMVYRTSIAYGSLAEALNALNNAAKKAGEGGGLTDDPRIVSSELALKTVRDLQEEYRILEQRAAAIADIRKKAINTSYSREYLLQQMAVDSPIKAGVSKMFDEINKESDNFSQIFAYNTTGAFKDGLRDAMSAAISQTDDLGAALQNVAMNFLKSMQGKFLDRAAGNITLAIGKGLGMAKGGLVSGGSGYRDDVPAMLTGGEFVMRKSAVEKYGVANLAKMNNGGMFIPGIRGGGAISGEDALRAFANQITTSGATDVLRGGASSAFINLEDQSQRLSRYALLGDNIISQEVRGAQAQAFDILENKSDFEKQKKEREKQERKALKRQLISTIAAAALSYGVGKSFPAKIPNLPIYNPYKGYDPYKGVKIGPLEPVKFLDGKAYGGMIRGYNSGGQVALMGGEYVLNRRATANYGTRFLDSMNQGRMPRFADGGEVGTSAPTTTTTESNAKMMGDVNISINVTGQNSQTETQGGSNRGGVDYKKMSERIKAVVLETLNEEKRLGGTLRTR